MIPTTGIVNRPRRVVVYGPEGIGKSSFAAKFPNPIFLDTEQGTEHLPVARHDVDTWPHLLAAIDDLTTNTQGYRTVVIDTADWAERLATAHILSTTGHKSIEDFGYGKGYTFLAEEWGVLLHKTRELRDLNFNVVFVAHSAVRKTELPDEAGAFDRYVLKLTQTPKNDLSAMLKEWADCVFFLNYKTHVTTDKNGKSRASGGKERTLFTQHTAAWDAKNRLGLEPEIAGKDIHAIWTTLAPFFDGQPEPHPIPTPAPPAPNAQRAPTTSGAFPARLFDAMCLSGIKDDELKAYLVARGFIPPEASTSNLDDTFVSAMLEDENWKKITAAIAAERK